MLTALPLALLILSAEPSTTQPADAPAAAPSHGMIWGNAPFLVGGVSTNPYFFGGVALNGGWILAAGLGVAYDGTKTTSQFSGLLVLHAEYMVKNMANYALGPEVTVIIPFAPAADPITVAPGLAFWYAPFSAPVLVGAALDVNLIFKTSSPSAFSLGTVTPGLRLAYVL